MTNLLPLKDVEITNQCVLICDLLEWTGSDSACWQSIKGSQLEIGLHLANAFNLASICRIDDFGGVCKTFLCNNEDYLENPPKTKPNAAIFSFTPKKRVEAEALDMARVAHLSGFRYLVLTLQKHDKFGKFWVLSSMLERLDGLPIYYEDTNTVVDELKTSSVGSKVIAVHVQSPGFENFVSKYADRVITQSEYLSEVLA